MNTYNCAASLTAGNLVKTIPQWRVKINNAILFE